MYKVMANQTLCKYANLTCDPEVSVVRAILTAFLYHH